MKKLATKEEMTAYGGLGYRMDVPEMISQCKVIHDCVDPEDNVSEIDRTRLIAIKAQLRKAIHNLDEILFINEWNEEQDYQAWHDEFVTPHEKHGY